MNIITNAKLNLQRRARWLFSRCQRCRRFGAETYRQRTRYVNDENNIVTLCPTCKIENDEYWSQRWLEVYRNM
jgi:Zn finger protein HypA/HybF involved in hydrogenase expression